MKITVEWLKEFIETDASAEEIGEVLTMLGIELEGIEHSAVGPVLNFKVTPNRGDCLSVLGLARELTAKDIARFKPTETMTAAMRGYRREDENERCAGTSVVIEDPDLCPRYAARLIFNVPNTQSSSQLRERLVACGMRPISVVVDITNAVMLELGQPLHAFDYDRLDEKRIVVRRARYDETIETLDGVTRDLSPEMLMICDANKPVAVAGVMGSANSEISPATNNILLESAHFDPRSIRSTRKALGLSTEASYRFERFVDPAGVVRATNRFADLLKQETGVDCEVGIWDVYPGEQPRTNITVRQSRWKTLLSLDVPEAAAASALIGLGCSVSPVDGGLTVVPPSWRSDLIREDDLVEEIGRIFGYEKIPELLPFGSTTIGKEEPRAHFVSSVRAAMLRMGFTEVATHTLCDRSPLDIQCERVEVRNPVAPELRLLRCSLLPGIAGVAARNRGRHLQLFEIGRVFHGERELQMLGFLVHGRLLEEFWTHKESPNADFFAAKGIVETLLRMTNRQLSFRESFDVRLLPGRRAETFVKNNTLGVLGEVSPQIAEHMDMPSNCVVCELDLTRLYETSPVERAYKPFSHFPPVRRDLAMLISKSVPYSDVEDAIKQVTGELLEDISPIDVYEGSRMEAGQHSLAVRMILRHPERTLTDEEANEVRDRAWAQLERLGAKPR